MKPRKNSPEIISVPEDALDAIKSRIEAGVVLEEDKQIILSIMSTHSWLSRQLRSTKLTIHRLKKLFGCSTEKRPWIKNKKTDCSQPTGDGTQQPELPSGAASDCTENSLKKR
jgi:hypothetical protein